MKQQKYLICCITIVLLIICSTIPSQADDTTITIICTNSFLADITRNIITNNATIDYIMPAGACPSHFDTTPTDVVKIASADIIISLGMEQWLTGAITAAGNTQAKLITCSGLGEWSNPTVAKRFVTTLRDRLSELLPERNTTIHEQTNIYLVQIDTTTTQLKEMITNDGCSNKNVISMQWQQEFITFLGLHVVASYGPPERLSTQDMLNISTIAAQANITVVVDNLQSGTEFGARIAAETGASHAIFTNFPGAIPGTDTYLEMLTYNTQQLINGIATYEYKQGEIASLEQSLAIMEFERNLVIVIVIIISILAGIFAMLYKRK